MYCKKCGKELPDGAKFCDSCGTSTTPEAASQASGNPSNAAQTTTPKPKVKIAILAVFAMIAIAVCVMMFGSSGYEKTIDNYFKGLVKCDAELFISTFSDDYLESQMGYNGYYNKAELISKVQDNLDSLSEDFEDSLGKGWKYQYKIIDVTELSDDWVEVTVDFEVSGKKNEESDVFIFSVVQENSEWLIDEMW